MHRRSGAPRLIEWTGERCVPWAPDVQVVYEHLHRYLWASKLTEGKRVLDLASGEGFGGAILAQSAASVLGIDTDQTTVDHSQLNYGGDNLAFQVGDARDLSGLEAGSFGAVVAFEMLEHIDDQGRVLDEVSRVLEPDGLLVISTPDRRAYSDATGQENPYHVRELDFDQFMGLLRSRFAHVGCWGQRTITGSTLSALDPAAGDDTQRTFFVQRDGDDWTVAGGLSPVYLVAVASNAPLPSISSESTLADGGIGLVRAVESEAREREAEWARRSEQLEAELNTRTLDLDRLSAERNDRMVEVELAHRRVAQLLQEADAREAEMTALRHVVGRVQQSFTWRLFERARAQAFALLGGPDSLAARALRRGLRGALRLLRGRKPALLGPATAGRSPLEFAQFDRVDVSIVIPVHSGAELTRRCLQTISDYTQGISYELILIDDAADQASKRLLAGVTGARILVNKRNLGYLRSVNLACSHARGRWIVLCNNDIEAYEGWLRAMLACGESSPDIGIVTPKYLNPDGSLSEAGGIVWRDGTAGNYGRGDDPAECRYEFRREVDYGSAAALMVRADFWRDTGGFDERYLPMYYEDTDLCFEARERGLRVMYEPRANVVHFEGSTAGTDVSTGHKRHQELNRPKFREKWRRQLERDQLPAGAHNVRKASNRNRGPHVLIVDHRVPMWDRDSGSLRLKGMIEALIELGCRVTMLPDDRHLVLPYTVDLMAMGVEVYYGEDDLRAELATIGPGLALIISCRPHATTHWLDLLREAAPGVPVVYDTVDLHWLREARRSAADRDGQAPPPGAPAAPLGPKAVALREIELALVRATEATLVVTEEERAQVEADVPGATVRVVPNINPVTEIDRPPDERSGVLFIGSFEHTPNVDAAIRLVRGVMPRVWAKAGEVPVTIVGAGPPPEVADLASPLVDVAGWVQEIAPVLSRARVMVAPLGWGAGLKGKVTQAMAAGLPVVTTPIGAEGLDAVDGEQLLIGTDDEELADRVVRILGDADLWWSLAHSGQALAADRWSSDVAKERLAELLADRRRLRGDVSMVADAS